MDATGACKSNPVSSISRLSRFCSEIIVVRWSDYDCNLQFVCYQLADPGSPWTLSALYIVPCTLSWTLCWTLYPEHRAMNIAPNIDKWPLRLSEKFMLKIESARILELDHNDAICYSFVAHLVRLLRHSSLSDFASDSVLDPFGHEWSTEGPYRDHKISGALFVIHRIRLDAFGFHH